MKILLPLVWLRIFKGTGLERTERNFPSDEITKFSIMLLKSLSLSSQLPLWEGISCTNSSISWIMHSNCFISFLSADRMVSISSIFEIIRCFNYSIIIYSTNGTNSLYLLVFIKSTEKFHMIGILCHAFICPSLVSFMRRTYSKLHYTQ